MPFFEFRAYAPDAPPDTPGIIRDGEGIWPSSRGYKAAPGARDTFVDDVTASALAAISIENLAGSTRTFVGTSTELLEQSTTSWVDRSRGGNDYTACQSWVFAQLGNSTFATNDVTPIQVSTGGAFSDASGAPVARYIEAVNNQLFAFDTNEGTFGDTPDRWWVSALGDTDDWTPSISTLCASGRLTATPGAITGARKLGDDIVVYKKKSLYLGRFFGPPTIWEFDLVSEEIGSVSHKGIVSLDTAHAFMGEYDFWVFNGSSLQSIGEGIRENFFTEEIHRDHMSKVVGVWNKPDQTLIWFYPSSEGAGMLDRYIVHHLPTRKWGPPLDLNVETAFFFINSTAPTYDTLGDLYSTYEDLPSFSYDNNFWTQRTEHLAVINTSNSLKTLDGSAVSSSILTFDFGANIARRSPDDDYYFVRRIRPRFTTYPTTGQMVNAYREDLGDDYTSDSPTSTLIRGKFDMERESRWHSVRMDFTGEMEVRGIAIDGQVAGEE